LPIWEANGRVKGLARRTKINHYLTSSLRYGHGAHWALKDVGLSTIRILHNSFLGVHTFMMVDGELAEEARMPSGVRHQAAVSERRQLIIGVSK